jgi:hypothetical protein
LFNHNKALFQEDELQIEQVKKMTPRRKMLATKVKKKSPAKKQGRKGK